MTPPLLPQLDPLTREVGFAKAAPAEIAKVIADWWQGSAEIAGVHATTLEEALNLLLPLEQAAHSRFLVVPTTSEWVAVFDNGSHGGDPFTFITRVVESLGVSGLRVALVDPSWAPNAYAARIIEIYEPDSLLFTRRSVAVAHDGSAWDFHTYGRTVIRRESSLVRRGSNARQVLG